MMPSAGRTRLRCARTPPLPARCTSARATSLIVPSPPHAITSPAPDDAASDRQLVRVTGALGEPDLARTPSRSSARVASPDALVGAPPSCRVPTQG